MLGPEAALAKTMSRGGPQKMAIMAGGGALIGALGAVNPFLILKPGEVAVKTRLGRTVREGWLARLCGREGVPYGTARRTGLHIVPSVSAKKMPTGDRTNDLQAFNVTDTGKKQIEIRASFTWGVSAEGDNPRIAYERIHRDNADFLAAASSICTSGLRAYMEGKSQADMKDNDTVQTNVIEDTKSKFNQKGLDMRDLWLENVSETEAQLNKDAMLTLGDSIGKSLAHAIRTGADVVPLPTGYRASGEAAAG